MFHPSLFPAPQQSTKRFSFCMRVTAESFSIDVVFPRLSYNLTETVRTGPLFRRWAIVPSWLAVVLRQGVMSRRWSGFIDTVQDDGGAFAELRMNTTRDDLIAESFSERCPDHAVGYLLLETWKPDATFATVSPCSLPLQSFDQPVTAQEIHIGILDVVRGVL